MVSFDFKKIKQSRFSRNSIRWRLAVIIFKFGFISQSECHVGFPFTKNNVLSMSRAI